MKGKKNNFAAAFGFTANAVSDKQCHYKDKGNSRHSGLYSSTTSLFSRGEKKNTRCTLKSYLNIIEKTIKV